MEFKNRLKGNIAQSLLETLLEDVKYRIVPLGIEKVIREVKSLSLEKYQELGLPSALRKLPDFFIASPNLDKNWLVEVKFRKKWDEKTRNQIGISIVDQAKQWTPLYIAIFLSEAAGPNDTPANYLRVCRLTFNNELGILKKTTVVDGMNFTEIENFKPWGDVTWDSMSRFQDVFTEVSDRWKESTLIQAIELIKHFNDSD